MNDSLHLLPTDRLAHHCEKQIAQFKADKPSDGSFCYELFRRATYDMPLAWDFVFSLYESHIRSRIRRHFAGSAEDIEDILQIVLIKFRRNVLTPERFKHFPNLSSVVAYLNGCVQSVVIDTARKQERQRRAESFSLDEGESVEPIASQVNTETILMEQEWRLRVLKCVKSHCKHRFDDLLVEQLWVNDLKPQDVYKQFPHAFSSVKQIHTQKRNLVDRIKRDSACRSLLEHAPN
ncbi:MAG: sigma-70 family RNA polymerase sigma factor [Anaerolineales bacterium]|nr:sigma-70 family RNA polymerase sigma factor [Anaerolineales bacterium]